MTSITHFKTIDEYIASFPPEVQSILQTIRETIKKEIPGAEETISYNIPAFKRNDKYIIYFSGWKKHTSIYPFSTAMETEIAEASSYNTSGKGTIQFPLNQPLPLPFIRKIVQFRVGEIEKESA